MSNRIMQPVPDRAEWNAYFPSDYSLSVYTAAKTNFDGADYPQKYQGKKKILVLLTDERYLEMANGTLFSTGNHPVETLLPMMHLANAGFSFDIATLSGQRAKFELWAMPLADEKVMDFYTSYLPDFQAPHKLVDLLPGFSPENYAAVFIPGGHGAMAGIPQSRDAGQMLCQAVKENIFVISLCHGPACLLAAELTGEFPFAGYEACVFPDSLDEGANVAIGYLPGHLKELAAGALQKKGVQILNDTITGQVHRDRILLTGDSPLASNALGRLAVETLLA